MPYRPYSALAIVAAVFASGSALAAEKLSASGLTGRQIAENVDARDRGDEVRQDLIMTLTDPSGSSRVRETVFLAKNEDGVRKSVIYFKTPSKLKGTGFLTYDYEAAAAEDDQWLYLPATGRARRISAGNRGDYFLATDFTYEDIKKQTTLSLDDFTFEYAGVEEINGYPLLIIEAKPNDAKTADELGYGRVRLAVDEGAWLAIRAEYWDTNLNPLKTVRLYDIAVVQGVITPHRIIAENHKTGHKTEFKLENVNYSAKVDNDLFTESAMRQGLD